REKSLVIVLVPIENQIDAILVEDSPQTLGLRRRSVRAGAEKRAMEIGERAKCPMSPEILAEPILLRFCLQGIPALEIELTVERYHVPIANVVAVVAFARSARSFAEV